MKLGEFRQRYPQYDDMSDANLVKAFHDKFYSDMPYADFASRIEFPLPGLDELKWSVETPLTDVTLGPESEVATAVRPQMDFNWLTQGLPQVPEAQADYSIPQPFDPSGPPPIEPYRPLAFEAMPEKTFLQKTKGFFVREPQYGRWTEPTRLEYLHKVLDIPLDTLTKYARGRTLGADKLSWYALSKIRPDLANLPLEEQMAQLSPYDRSGFQKMTGQLAEFIGQIQTAVKMLKTLGWKSPQGKRITDRIGRNAPPWMTSGAIDALVTDIIAEKSAPEIARDVATQAAIRGGEAIAFSGLEWTAGKAFQWALRKFPRFRLGWQRWAKGKSQTHQRTARQEVDAALDHYKRTGDRTQWDAVRVKYAGIKPETAEAMRPKVPPPVQDFGKYPLAPRETPRMAVPPIQPTPQTQITPPARPQTPERAVGKPAPAKPTISAEITKEAATAMAKSTGEPLAAIELKNGNLVTQPIAEFIHHADIVTKAGIDIENVASVGLVNEQGYATQTKAPDKAERLRLVRQRAPAKPAPAAKEAWEMTKAEFEKEAKEIRKIAGITKEAIDKASKDFVQTKPDWGPLELIIPEQWRDGFMYMGREGHIRLYKHGITRNYLNVGPEGETYKYVPSASYKEMELHARDLPGGKKWERAKDRYVAIPKEQALDNVFRGLEQMGWTRETKYNDAFRFQRDKALAEAGFTSITGKPDWPTEVSGEAITHRRAVAEALEAGKPIPPHILEEYKSEKWAQEALTERIKEKPYEKPKESITEPAPSPQVEQRLAKKVVPEGEPTGQLDPSIYKDALEITRLHANWVGYDKRRPVLGGIYSEKWDKERGMRVPDKVEYTPEEIDAAYRTVQKPIPSPMPDTQLFAMPGREAAMKAIGQKMAKIKGRFPPHKKGFKLTRPPSLPKPTDATGQIKALYNITPKETTRYAINGIKVEENGKLAVVTDGHRLFVAHGNWGKDGLYLDQASLKNGVLGKPEKKKIAFPRWRDIMPDITGKQPTTTILPQYAKDLETALYRLRQASLITTEESKGVVIILNPDGSLGFASASAEVGHSEINLQPGGKVLGGWNPRFILDAMNFHAKRGDKSIEIYWQDERRPLLTRSSDGKTQTITQPINIEHIGEAEPIKKALAPKGKPGFVQIEAFAEIPKTFMRIMEPSKAVERRLGKPAYAKVIRGTFGKAEAKLLEFNSAKLAGHDKSINEFGEWLEQFPERDLKNLMLSRGDPVTVNAQLIKRDAMRKLPKELRGIRILNAIQQIADFNYAFLQEVAGDDINKVADYFYGIYKNPKMVDKFLDYWRTTKRFTKEKKIPTTADAVDYGLELRSWNPIDNLRAEYRAIAHLQGMEWLKDELMRTGKGKYIDDFPDAPMEWEKIQEPAFAGLRADPDLAELINKLISTNKIARIPPLNTLRHINNFLRTIKFIGSAFHMMSIAKQSIADSGYAGFVHKKTALRGVTTGFRKNDPIFQTPEYRDYIEHGGGHRYSMESEAQHALNNFVKKLNKELGIAAKYGLMPLRLPVTFVNWMFNSYIPKVKYSKYLDTVAEQQKKRGRALKDYEKIDIIKEQQNFYGMMNERLFGRSGTATTVLRFFFMAPGYAEGNFRTILKSALQWKGKDAFRAGRSRSNIVNSFLLTSILATVGTLILTGKWPKKPESIEDIRDLFKVDTGKKDDKRRRIMIDLMTYDKDYWNVYGNLATGQIGKIPASTYKRIGGMKATTLDVAIDLALIAQGRGIYDWKGDRVVEITDPFLRKAMKLAVYEVKKTEPISWSVFKQSKRRQIDNLIAGILTVQGFRPTMSEKDKREQAITNRIYSLKGQQEQLYQYLKTVKKPREAVKRYNRTVNSILDSKMVPEAMRKEWKPKLIIDLDRYLQNRAHAAALLATTEDARRKVERAIKTLRNFGISPKEADELLMGYYSREKKKPTVGPLERHPVIGRGLKRGRLQERMQAEK